MFFIWFDDLSELGTDALAQKEWRWCRVGPGSHAEGRASLERIGALLASQPDEVSLLLAARECTYLELKVPPMSARSVRRALPFIAEEHIAQPVENTHFAIGDRRGEHLHCLCVSKPLLHLLLEVLSEYGISPVAAYSDATLLRVTEGRIGLLTDGDRVLIRSAHSALEATCSDASIYLESIIQDMADSHPELHLETLVNEDADLPDGLAHLDVAVTQKRIARSALAELLSRPIAEINLLTAEFEPQTPNRSSATWKLPLSLAASLLAVLLASDVIVGVNATNRGEALQAESLSLVTGLQTSEEVVRLIHREQGSRSQETREFLNLLAQISALSSAHGASLRTLSYQSGSGSIDIEVIISDYDSLDGFSSEAQQAFQEADMLGATQTGEGVRARLRLGGVGR